MREHARTIVYRHACNCHTANQPPGDHPDHRFDVDGQSFPWLITETGSTFKHLNPLGVYTCAVTILDVDPDTHATIPITFDTGWPKIGGKPFPWQILDCQMHITPGFHTSFYVEFLADNVDTDGPIEDVRVP